MVAAGILPKEALIKAEAEEVDSGFMKEAILQALMAEGRPLKTKTSKSTLPELKSEPYVYIRKVRRTRIQSWAASLSWTAS